MKGLVQKNIVNVASVWFGRVYLAFLKFTLYILKQLNNLFDQETRFGSALFFCFIDIFNVLIIKKT